MDDNTEEHEPYASAVAPRPWLRLALVAVAAIALLGGGAGTVYFLKFRQPASKPAVAATVEQQPVNPAEPGDASPQQYVSNGKDLNLTFTYPSTWSASPDSNNNADDATIMVTSPLVTIDSSSGRSVTGRVVVEIRPVTASLTEFASGKATTAQDSVQIGYDKPTAHQHQYPYITFVDLSGGSTAGAFSEVLITGVSSYPKDIPISTDSLEIDPVVSATFYQCATQACSGSGVTLLPITLATWQNDQTAKQALSIFQSLQIQ